MSNVHSVDDRSGIPISQVPEDEQCQTCRHSFMDHVQMGDPVCLVNDCECDWHEWLMKEDIA